MSAPAPAADRLGAALVVYGPLARTTGGNLYDRALCAALADCGVACTPVELPARRYLSNLLSGRKSARACRRAAVDLWLIDELVHPSLWFTARSLPRGRRVALVHHLRSSERHPAPLRACYRFFERRFLRAMDGVIANSGDTLARALAARGAAVPCAVILPGRDRLPPAQAAARLRRPAGAGPLRALFVGALTRHKGLHTLLAAIERVPSPLAVRVVGDAAAAPRYAAAQRRAAATARWPVELVGAVSDEALAAELEACDVLAVPSAFEGFGMVHLEACARGAVPIGCARGGAGELIRDGENGFLVAPDDVARLAARLDALAGDRALLDRMARAARASVATWPTWREQASRAAAFLRSVSPVLPFAAGATGRR